jgi:hypothetical protein
MGRRASILGVFIMLPIIVGACDNFIGVRGCDTIALPGVTVEVRDSITGQPAVDGAKLLLVAGAYRDSAGFPLGGALDRTTLSGAHERPDRYLVTVTKPGYAEWRSFAWVREDDCHVKTVRFVALLQRL